MEPTRLHIILAHDDEVVGIFDTDNKKMLVYNQLAVAVDFEPIQAYRESISGRTVYFARRHDTMLRIDSTAIAAADITAMDHILVSGSYCWYKVTPRRDQGIYQCDIEMVTLDDEVN